MLIAVIPEINSHVMPKIANPTLELEQNFITVGPRTPESNLRRWQLAQDSHNGETAQEWVWV